MPGPRTTAAFYAASVEEFLAASEEAVYVPLASPHGYTLAPGQQSAWLRQLLVLRAALEDQVAPQSPRNSFHGSGRPLPYCHASKPRWHWRSQSPDDVERPTAPVGDVVSRTEEGVRGGKASGAKLTLADKQ